jgi:hypothetical protein
MAQKVVQYQAVLQLAQSAPQLYDLPLLHRQMIEVLGIKNASKLVPTEEDLMPTDPVQENQNLLNMLPVKAFVEQNHQAHIAVHTSAIQNPRIQQMMQMNPQAQQIMAAAMAHINEHVAFQYRLEVEQMMGMPLPPEVDKGVDPQNRPEIPKEMADKIAIAAAQASQQLLQRDQQQAQQQQQQAQQQDPALMMQQQELQLRQQDLQLRMQKQQIDAAEKADRLRVEQERIQAQERIAAMQVGANAAHQRDKLNRDQQTEGARMGVDIAKHKADKRVDKARIMSDAGKHVDHMQMERNRLAAQERQSVQQMRQQAQQPKKETE